MDKLIALLLALALMTGAMTVAFAEQESDFGENDYTSAYTLYLLDEKDPLEDSVNLYFFDGVEDLPWIELEELGEMLTVLQNEFNDQPNYKLTYEQEGSVITLRRENSFYMEVNFNADTITFNDYNGFLTDPTDKSLLDMMTFSGYNEKGEVELVQRDPLASFDRYGDMMVLNLPDYDIQLRMADGCGFIPLQLANDFLFSQLFRAEMLFNGQAVYLAKWTSLEDLSTGELTPLGKMYYDVEPTERSEALADFGYSELCLMMDCLYGLKEQHNIESFGRLFWQVGFDEPLSSLNPKDADTALRNFINYYLDDIHSSFGTPSWMSGRDEDIEYGGNNGPSRVLSDNLENHCKDLRQKVMGDDIPGYQEIGNTAYITFDIFDSTYAGAYYEAFEAGKTVPDTIGLVINAHQQIFREDSPIEKVVIDLSCNTGGSSDAGIFMLAWIVGRAEVSVEDAFTGAQSTMVSMADVNMDRKFDEKDTLAGKKVYVLTSGASFSCGNLVPAVCKCLQAATLIGRQTGGGACAVQSMSTAWGTTFEISGTSRLSFRRNGSFYDIDEGVAPDIYIDDLATLYDSEKLTELINGLN